MSKIGGLDLEDLARAVADWPMIESYDLLITVMTSLFQDSSNSEARSLNNIHESEGSARLDILFAAGDDAYESQGLFALAENVPRRSFAIAFLSFIAFSVALNSDPPFSRIVLETGLLSFVIDLYPNFSKETTIRQQSYFFPAHLTLHTLLERLDPEVDSLFISQLKNMLDENFVYEAQFLAYEAQFLAYEAQFLAYEAQFLAYEAQFLAYEAQFPAYEARCLARKSK
ncbi:hypothetical protein FB446DRAFT_793982 [Lentinula raphanica]|nr:hypothetical protein FB446DRAFT_793982 [Lentinula raphanica]